MARLYGLVLGLTMALGVAHAERRALVVGIDNYAPAAFKARLATLGHFDRIRAEGRGFNPLEGAVKDARAVAAALTGRYGLQDVRLLLDGDATRAALLAALDRLLADSQPGDTAVFYFAGHGSQITNLSRPEGDRLEQTLVPVDAWRGAVEALPAPVDIRDKTLAERYNAALDRGVQLVVIVDACHSGGSWRWVPKQGFKTRALRADQREYRLPPFAGPDPAQRGLFLAAAAASEPALEHGGRGAFTQGLLEAIERLPGDASVDAVFARAVVALRQATGSPQRPVLAGPRPRQHRPLLTGARPRDPVDSSQAPTRIHLPPGQGAWPKPVAEVARALAQGPRFKAVAADEPCDLSLVWQAPAALRWRLCRPGPSRDLSADRGDAVGHVLGQADRFDRTRRWLARGGATPVAGELMVNGQAGPGQRLTPGEVFRLAWSGPTEATYLSVVDTTLAGNLLCSGEQLKACRARPDAHDPAGPITFTVSTWARPLTRDEQARAFSWAGLRATSKGAAQPLPALVSILHVPAWLGPDPQD